MTQVSVNTQVSVGGGGGGGDAGLGLLVVAAIAFFFCWLVFYPSYWITTNLYSLFRFELYHPLYAGILAGFPSAVAFFMLWRFKEFRYLYFAVDTIWATSAVHGYVQQQSDPVWAGFFALLTFCACLPATYFAANCEGLPGSEDSLWPFGNDAPLSVKANNPPVAPDPEAIERAAYYERMQEQTDCILEHHRAIRKS